MSIKDVKTCLTSTKSYVGGKLYKRRDMVLAESWKESLIIKNTDSYEVILEVVKSLRKMLVPVFAYWMVSCLINKKIKRSSYGE